MSHIQETLPISAIIPVLNCAHRMREHMEKSLEWLPHVEEIIVVDSNSADKSIEIIEDYVGHLNLRVVTQPVGLYESWNRGVAEASSTYVYFSTVGDYISLSGLSGLLKSAEDLQADVVISPPTFQFEAGQADAEKSAKRKRLTWPIHDIVRILEIREPTLMDPQRLYDFVLIYLESSILGSSASNLYRRTVLEKHPFSADFLSAGDSAWIVEHNFDSQIVIHPDSVSSFLFHDKDWSDDTTQHKRTEFIRRRLAKKAYGISLDHATCLSEDAKSTAKKLIEHSLGSSQDDARQPVDIEYLKSITDKHSKDEQLFLERFNNINLEVEFLRRKSIDRNYRHTIGPIRYIWPPAIFNRAKRKRLLERINESIQTITVNNRSTGDGAQVSRQ